MAGTVVVLMSCSFCNMMGAAGIDDRPRHVTADAYIEDVKYCPFCGEEL